MDIVTVNYKHSLIICFQLHFLHLAIRLCYRPFEIYGVDIDWQLRVESRNELFQILVCIGRITFNNRRISPLTN